MHDEVKKLIDDMVDTKNPDYEGNNWLPHIAFSYETPINKINLIRAGVESLLPIGFVLSQIYLLREYNLETDEREIVKTFKLK